MPDYVAPGVYVQEVPTAVPIEGVSTGTAGFLGISERTLAPAEITSLADFEDTIGAQASAYLAGAVRGFFNNGGTRCYVALVAAGESLQAGLAALATKPISILCCPDEQRFPNAAEAISAHCEERRDRICILQSTEPVMPEASHAVPVRSSYAAYYYPWLTVAGSNATSDITIPPCGHVAGVYARSDVGSAHSSPAAIAITGVKALSQDLTAAQSETLQSKGINTIRFFPGKGTLLWGERTTGGDADFQYVSVRRLMIFVEQSLLSGLQWMVFEPNGEPLWAAVRLSVEGFLLGIWKAGALKGETPQQAFFVRCDETTMTQGDLDVGRLIMIVGMAPVRPAEFVIVQIAQLIRPPKG